MAESPPHSVAEMQGLYGPFTMHERVVQKIWLQQDFAAGGVALLDGRTLEILTPGRWNLLGGPDFKDARLRVGGQEVAGDVEVHFHAGDWLAHGHGSNPAFANVVLHVLLFPPSPEVPVSHRRDGRAIPALVLLPLLHRDLEEYAADDALETLTERDEWRRVEELGNQPPDVRRARLGELAARRWQAKVASARTRLARLGWAGAAHHTALEILGYRRNRVPMLAAAERWPLEAWRDGAPAADAAFATDLGWQLHGVRPANHPRTRLAQYKEWVRRVPDWPERLAAWGQAIRVSPVVREVPTARCRRGAKFADLRAGLDDTVTARSVGGPRFGTLVCDGFLPLLAAMQGREDFFPLWFHWYPGDMPDAVRRGLRRLEITGGRGWPLSHGVAQGLLAWLIERGSRA